MSEVLFVVTNKMEIAVPTEVRDEAPDDFPEEKLLGGFHMTEMGVPYEYLTSKGYAISFVSPDGGRAIPYKFDPTNALHKKLGADATLQKKLANTLHPRMLDHREYDAIFYVGGLAAMWGIPDSAELQSLTAAMYETGRPVAGICHGPAGLVNVELSNGQPLVKGRKITSLTNKEEMKGNRHLVVPFPLESKLRERGANFTNAAAWEERVVVDEVAVYGINRTLITGQNPASVRLLAWTLDEALRS